MAPVVVADPCLEDGNYQLLIRTLWDYYFKTENNYEYLLVRDILTKIFLIISPETLLLLGLKRGFEPFLDLEDWDTLNGCRRPPWEVIEVLKKKHGYILDHLKDNPDRKYLIRWEGLHAAFFLDPPDELFEHFGVPVLSMIAKWRQQCYAEFIQKFNEEEHATV